MATPTWRQARATVALPTPRWSASNRVDQCVTPYFFGGALSVVATIVRWSTTHGRPERAWAPSPDLARRTGPAA